MPINDLTGKRFGYLRVLSLAKVQNRRAHWLCLCDCGTKTVKQSKNLTDGSTKSCGCLRKKLVSARFSTHKKSNLPEYRVWALMKSRCTNPKNSSYENYGGRGISISDRWTEFTNFYADMGPRPSTKHSIDRIDNNGDYTPSNCRWATWITQCNNKRQSRVYRIDGVDKTITEWANHYGINPSTLRSRLRSGWSILKSVNTPVKK